MAENLTILSQSKEADADYGVFKIVALGLCGFFFSLLTIWFFQSFLESVHYGILIPGALFATLFVAMLVLQSMMIKSSAKLRVIALCEGIAPLIIFYKHLIPVPSSALVVGAVLSALFFLGATAHGRTRLMNSLKINFWEVARSVVPKAVTGILIFVSIILYANYFEWDNFKEDIGKRLTHESLRGGEGIVRIFVPGFSVDNPVSQAIQAFTERELQKNAFSLLQTPTNEVPVSFDELPEATKERLISEVSARFKEALQRVIGPFSSEESTHEIVYRLLKNSFERLPEFSQSIVGVVIAVLAFFVLRGIASLLYWLVEFVAFLIFKFLLTVRFAHIAVETRSREFISLS